MKKLLVSLIFLTMSFVMFSCTTDNYQVPDLIGMDLTDAKLTIAGAVRTQVTYESTNQYLPNVVIGYGKGIEVNDMVKNNSTLELIVAQAPENSFSRSDMIAYVNTIGYVTGPDSQNFDLLRAAGAGSTDLGISFTVNDKLVFLYGDTFSGTESMSGIWKSNFIAISEDQDLSDGLLFSRLVTSGIGYIQPFAAGNHQANQTDDESDVMTREVTKIPTGGIQIGDDVYLFYMSVRYWGTSGAWAVSYNQAVKTDTDFSSFSEVESLRWTEELASNFGQIYPFENPDQPDYIYFVSIPGGRFGGVALFRVQKTNFEDFESYEYFMGGTTWVTGTAGLQQFKNDPYLILQAPCGELSIMYNNYLGKWMIVYLRNSEIVMQTADSLTGEWSSTETIMSSSDFNGLYGGFVCTAMTEYDGQKFYMQLSRWLPIYQTQLIEVVLN